MLSQA
jgi:hypothetical protein